MGIPIINTNSEPQENKQYTANYKPSKPLRAVSQK